CSMTSDSSGLPASSAGALDSSRDRRIVCLLLRPVQPGADGLDALADAPRPLAEPVRLDTRPVVLGVGLPLRAPQEGRADFLALVVGQPVPGPPLAAQGLLDGNLVDVRVVLLHRPSAGLLVVAHSEVPPEGVVGDAQFLHDLAASLAVLLQLVDLLDQLAGERVVAEVLELGHADTSISGHLALLRMSRMFWSSGSCRTLLPSQAKPASRSHQASTWLSSASLPGRPDGTASRIACLSALPLPVANFLSVAGAMRATGTSADASAIRITPCAMPVRPALLALTGRSSRTARLIGWKSSIDSTIRL